MSSLKTIQTNFLQSMFNKSDIIINDISSSDAKDRLSVHQNTIYNSLCHVLRVIYPGIWKLLGNECADRATLLFCTLEDNLPISGCLDAWGKNFPRFLASVPAFAKLTYLQDYARYEYLYHQAYCGYGRSTYFFKSKHPIDQIQSFLQLSNAERLDLNRKSSYAIIMRPQDKVITLWITEERWHSLRAQESALV